MAAKKRKSATRKPAVKKASARKSAVRKPAPSKAPQGKTASRKPAKRKVAPPTPAPPQQPVAKPAGTINQRQGIRFAPEPGEFALIEIVPADIDFKPTLVGLILEESHRGCSLVVSTLDQFQVGDRCRVKVGKLAPMKAEVRWRNIIDPKVSKIGFFFLE